MLSSPQLTSDSIDLAELRSHLERMKDAELLLLAKQLEIYVCHKPAWEKLRVGYFLFS
jgi:hypothetical protein